MRFRHLVAAIFMALFAAMPSPADAEELNILLVVDDAGSVSLGRNNKILVDVAKAWTGGLQSTLPLQVVQQAGNTLALRLSNSVNKPLAANS